MIAIERRPRLSTSRLTLRPPEPRDAAAIACLGDDRAVARMTTGVPHPLNLAQTRAFLERMAACDPAREALFVIDTPADGPVGVIGFHPNGEGAPELGFWLGRRYWGRGLATKAAEAALYWAGGAWGKRYVVAGHFTDNPASAGVLIKAGFLHTGRVELRRSLARDEPAPTRMMVWLA